MKKSLALASVLLVAGQLLPTRAAGAAGATKLAGLTKIVGSSTAVTTVVLSQPVEISARTFDNPDINVSSTGELAGLVLKPSGRSGPELIALSVDPCDAAPCDQDHLEFVQTYPFKGNGKLRLRTGSYELYLIAEGGRTEVTLDLRGLAGQTVVRPSSKAGSSFGELTPWAVGDQAGVAYNASASHSLEGMGFTLVALELEASTHLAGDYSSCLRRADEGVPPTAYEESCSGVTGGWAFVTPAGDPGRALFVGLALEGQGEFIHTAAYRSAATVESMRAIGFSLSYETGSGSSRSFSSTFSFDS